LKEGKKLLSIIIPTRRDPSRIIKHLNEVFQSNTTLIELIVVYDCFLPDIALSRESHSDQLKQKIIQIQFHATKVETGIGPGGARNLGIKFATGEYVTFVDDDDEISINYLKLIELLNTSSINIIVGEFSHPNECFSRKNTTNEKKITVREYINRLNSQNKILNHCTGILINRNFLIKNSIKFLETRLVEDLVFTTKLLSIVEDIQITNTLRYEYKLQQQSTKNLMNVQTFSCLIKAIYELIHLKKNISGKYFIDYLEEKIYFLEVLLKARAPLLLRGKKQKNSSIFELILRIKKITYDKNNIILSVNMIWLG
jgi:glycosyltransferase involved in cell wall biosynthesis